MLQRNMYNACDSSWRLRNIQQSESEQEESEPKNCRSPSVQDFPWLLLPFHLPDYLAPSFLWFLITSPFPLFLFAHRFNVNFGSLTNVIFTASFSFFFPSLSFSPLSPHTSWFFWLPDFFGSEPGSPNIHNFQTRTRSSVCLGRFGSGPEPNLPKHTDNLR